MLMITDAASETIFRLDMTDPFLRLVNKLSLRKVQRADYAKTIMGGRFILGLISAFVLGGLLRAHGSHALNRDGATTAHLGIASKKTARYLFYPMKCGKQVTPHSSSPTEA
jgi:hypothetical protein